MREKQPLTLIAELDVPPEVMRHRYAIVALAVASKLLDRGHPTEQVIGTARDPKVVQLYGWNPGIPKHRDNTGIIYGLCLDPGRSKVFATFPSSTSTDPDEQTVQIEIGSGSLFRLDDRFSHWTQDLAPRVLAFIGPFDKPADSLAISALTNALRLLVAGSYYNAPRVSEGFRILADDECYATENFTDFTYILKSDLSLRGAHMIECGLCSAPATCIDHYWPIYVDGSRCARCDEQLGDDV